MNTKRKGWKVLTAQEFKTIKALQEAGISANRVAAVTGRAGGTVSRIFAAPDIDTYKARIRGDKSRRDARLAQGRPEASATVEEAETVIGQSDEPQVVPVSSEAYMQLLTRSVTASERQADALEALVDAWNSKPRKGLFS